MKKELNKPNGIFVKKSKMSLAKSTTALTCLVGLFIVSSDPATSASTSGQFIASTSIANACTISAGAMTFADYTGADTITRTSVVTVDCSTGANYTISFNDSATTAGKYIMQRSGGAVNSDNQLLVSFTNGTAAMTSGAATITGVGAGTSSAAGTITGSIASGQTGKSAGTYSKTMTLNLNY